MRIDLKNAKTEEIRTFPVFPAFPAFPANRPALNFLMSVKLNDLLIRFGPANWANRTVDESETVL